MFGMSNKEKLLLLSIIKDRDGQLTRERMLSAAAIHDLKEQLVHERLRAEGAINLVLMKTVKAVLTPQDPMSDKEIEKREEQMYGIFGDEGESALTKEQEKILTDLQTMRTI